MLQDFSLAQLAALSLLVFLAGFVDALAGGGGLITLPAYLAAGINPALLLGTNKLSSSIGTVVSVVRYLRAAPFAVTPFLPAIAASLIGSVIGARLALMIDPALMRYILLAALPLVAYSVVSKHQFGKEDHSAEFPPRELLARTLGVSFPVGCYDGFFGPGTGTFFALGFNKLCGYDLLKATTGAKLLNLASNVAALSMFLCAGKVHLRLGLAMGALSLLGHYAGSGWAIKHKSRAIRPMILLVCGLLFFKLLLDAGIWGWVYR